MRTFAAIKAQASYFALGKDSQRTLCRNGENTEEARSKALHEILHEGVREDSP